MELEFDKEMDALLRAEAGGRTITIGEFAGGHPDADEVAAFLENAVPGPARLSMVAHFADCAPCRSILSNAISLVPDGYAVEKQIAAPSAAAAVPWYRRLFLFPNLAYVMGGLVLLFSGFIGLSLLRSGVSDGQYELSRSAANTSSPERAPVSSNANSNVVSKEAELNANSASNAASTANSNAAHSLEVGDSAERRSAGTGPGRADSFEEAQNLRPLATQAPPSLSVEKEVTGKDADDRRGEFSTDAVRQPQAAPEKLAENERAAGQTLSPPPPAPRTAGPFRTQQQQAQLPGRDQAANEAKSKITTATPTTPESERRRVSGKSFELRSGVWYDTAYRGQSTINIRRATEEYGKLDSGLRRVAEGLSGTIVVVWGGKAYRID